MIRSDTKRKAQQLLHGNYGSWGILAIVPCLSLFVWVLFLFPLSMISTESTTNAVDQEYNSWQNNNDEDRSSTRTYEDGYNDGYSDGYEDGYNNIGLENEDLSDLNYNKSKVLSLESPSLEAKHGNRRQPVKFFRVTWILVFFILWLSFFIALLLGFISITYQGLLQWAAVDTVTKKHVQWKKVFKEFYIKHWEKTITANLLISLFTFFWSLLFVVPGIVKQISYRMTNYLMKKDATLSPTQAIKLSQQLMNGYKLEYLIFVYSFILWEFLSVFTAGLSLLYSVPYFSVTEALFFDRIIEDKHHVFSHEK